MKKSDPNAILIGHDTNLYGSLTTSAYIRYNTRTLTHTHTHTHTYTHSIFRNMFKLAPPVEGEMFLDWGSGSGIPAVIARYAMNVNYYHYYYILLRPTIPSLVALADHHVRIVCFGLEIGKLLGLKYCVVLWFVSFNLLIFQGRTLRRNPSSIFKTL